MKKALVILIGVLMAVMFAAESYAAIEVGGTIDVRGRWRENNNDLNKDASGSTAFWQEKVNIWVDAKIAEGLKGYVELQSGGGASKGWFTLGTGRTNADSAPNSFFYENEALGGIQIRYAYIDFMIPSTPVGIKIGHFPVVLGHSIWANTGIWGSDGLLIYAMPIKELMIGLGTLKGFDTATNSERADADLYVLLANYTFMPKNTVGFNASYVNRAGGNNNILSNEYWADQSAGGAANDAANTQAFNLINNVKFWNVMLTVDGALDMGLGYKFEIDKQFGKITTGATTGPATATDFKMSGLAFLAGADFKIANIAKVGLDVAYGSGDKCTAWVATTAGSNCSSSGDKFEGYVNFNDYAYTMIYEDIVGQKRAASSLTAADLGLYNTMYAKLGAGATPIKDMSIDLNVYYLRAVKEYYYAQKKNIGLEADLIFGYNIYKNLKWTFMAGYFFPGNHYDEINSADTVKGDAAWAFEQKLSLKF
ncbi:MAG: hypothetical protein HZC10_07400 [Nitrospirae bacterium]|nr:hypothetical protein [Nitrospirota bacterium]